MESNNKSIEIVPFSEDHLKDAAAMVDSWLIMPMSDSVVLPAAQ